MTGRVGASVAGRAAERHREPTGGRVKRRGEIGTPMFTREPDTEEHQ